MLTGLGAATWVAFAVYFVGYFPSTRAPRAIGMINFVQGVAMVTATYLGGWSPKSSATDGLSSALPHWG